MGDKYGAINSGTTREKLILWGAGFPVIELNVEDTQARPLVTIVGDEMSGGRTIEIDFADATTTATKHLCQAYEKPLRQAEGWQVGTAIEGGSGLYIIDPSERYHFELIATEQGLTVYLCDFSVEGGLSLMAFRSETLEEKGAWPVLPLPKNFGLPVDIAV